MIINESGYKIKEWLKGKDIKDSHIHFEPIIRARILELRKLEIELADIQPEKEHIIKNILEENRDYIND